jgi:hypothetical protein
VGQQAKASQFGVYVWQCHPDMPRQRNRRECGRTAQVVPRERQRSECECTVCHQCARQWLGFSTHATAGR